jgi:hypothetical protein
MDMKKIAYCLVTFQTALFAQGGLLGGVNNGSPILYSLNVDAATTVPITGLPASGSVSGVDLSGTEIGLVGGESFANIINTSTNLAAPIQGISPTNQFISVSISDDGTKGLLGGLDGANPIAYFVHVSSSTATAINGLSPLAKLISRVTISGDGTRGLLAGGQITGNGSYGYLYDLATNTTNQVFFAGSSQVVSLSIDEMGNYGLIGLQNSVAQDAAYILNLNTLTSLAIPSPVSLESASVSINDSGTIGLVGAREWNTNLAIAFKLEIQTNSLAEIPIASVPVTGTQVAIDSLGEQGLIGGTLIPQGFFAYSVDLNTNHVTAVEGLPSTGGISSIDMQASGKAGLIGGKEGIKPVAFLLPDLRNTPSLAIRLNLAGATNGFISSVSLGGLLNLIPTNGLSGNNLRLANFLNTNASDTASFFIPSVLNGTLANALESVSPLRNSASLFALNNNFFALRQGLTQRAIVSRQTGRNQELEEISLLASLEEYCCYENQCQNHTFWGQLIGFEANQESQNQMPRFHPLSIGFILGYDYPFNSEFLIGASAAYMYTHLQINHHQGHSNINQEYLSLYGLWESSSFYVNAALWFGLYQMDRVRDIHLDEFDFRAASHGFGYQFDPHLELGYDYRFCECKYTIEPFILFDFLNSWQNSYKESGSGPFLFRQHDLHAWVFQAETGLRFYQKFPFCSWNLIVQENGSYIYRKPHNIGDMNVALIGAPGSVTLLAFTNAQNLGSAGIEFIFEPICPSYPVGTIEYKGEFGSGYQSHEVMLGMEWSF